MLRYVKPDTMKLFLTATFCGLALLSSAPTQGTRPLAITNARILTMEGATIDNGTVLIRNGKIQTVGDEVKLPAGTQIIDAKGGTLMPGLVSAYSRAGLSGSSATPSRRGSSRRGPPRGFRMSRGRSSSGAGRNSAATKVAHAIYARQNIFHTLLEAGVTSLALAPTGTGFPGQGALLNLSGKTRSSLVADDAMFVAINPANNTKAKKLIKDTFASAKKLIEERNKPAATPAKKTRSGKRQKADRQTKPK
jgi:cytosine/adenosine deaminase-related metal-dependent hydrolase